MNDRMRDTRFTRTDLDGDTLGVAAGSFGAVVWVELDEDEGVEDAVSVRYKHLPALIAALQGILDESVAEEASQ
jgi:hypothetical protein